VDDRPAITVDEFFAVCASAKAKHDIDIVYVDYLQKIQVKDAQTREEAVSTVSNTLTVVAKELDIPVVAISVLAKDGSSRNSGMIDYDCDVHIAIDRDEGEPDKTILNIRKNRNYKTGQVTDLVFAQDFAAFYDPDERFAPVIVNSAGF